MILGCFSGVFDVFLRGNLNKSLFLNVHLRSSFLIVNLKRTKVLDKWLLLFFIRPCIYKIGHILLLDVFVEFFRLYKTGIYPRSLENDRIHVHVCKAGRIRWRHKTSRSTMWPILLWKKKRCSQIERFLSLQIDDEKAGAQIDVQERVPIQIPAKKTCKAFSKRENFWMSSNSTGKFSKFRPVLKFPVTQKAA